MTDWNGARWYGEVDDDLAHHHVRNLREGLDVPPDLPEDFLPITELHKAEWCPWPAYDHLSGQPVSCSLRRGHEGKCAP